jgi:DNA-binding response OmpR family regulator
LLWDDLPPEAQQAAQARPVENKTLQGAGLVVEGQLFSPVFAAFARSKKTLGISVDDATGDILLNQHPLTTSLTAKEHALLIYFIQHPSAICTKDELIQAVWPEDKIFDVGVRDDSLAQLIRRVRIKIEADPSKPVFVLTIPGRGYRLNPAPGPAGSS